MIDRRNLITSLAFSSACAAALGTSFVLRRRMTHVPPSQMALLAGIPSAISGWRAAPPAEDMIDPVVVDEAFAEALQHYDTVVEHTYVRSDSDTIMLNIAYMRSVEQETKFHWPEFCYATQGFRVEPAGRGALTIAPIPIETTRFVAVRGERFEMVHYWTRVGPSVAAGSMRVRLAILRSDMAGRVPDAVLVRASTFMPDVAAASRRSASAVLDAFTADLLRATAPPARAMLIGTEGMV